MIFLNFVNKKRLYYNSDDMEISKVYSVFFSATFSTRKIIREIVKQLGYDSIEYDITDNAPEETLQLRFDELLVVGVPVYSGRVPEMAIERLNRIKGSNTPAVIVCVYGNRDFDDALIELKDIVRANGFIPLSGAAVIAQHSMLPQIAENRPDEKDMLLIDDFAAKVKDIIVSLASVDASLNLYVKGNEPYRQRQNIPIHPSANNLCNKCGTCARLCPTGAISSESPQKTDKNKCISCGRCIMVCPKKARNFRGLLYKLASWKFKKTFSARKEPSFFYLK